MKLALSAAALSAIALTGSASAASVTTFTDGHNDVAHFQYFTTADGVDFVASASTEALGYKVAAKVGEYSNGLGVSSPWLDSHTLDGALGNETLWFTFEEDYAITDLIFGYADDGDDIKVVDGDGSTLGLFNLASANYMDGYAYLDITSLNLTTSKFGITVSDFCDEVKVKGFNGHAVPTPSAALAGLVGLVGLAARRRKQDEAAA